MLCFILLPIVRPLSVCLWLSVRVGDRLLGNKLCFCIVWCVGPDVYVVANIKQGIAITNLLSQATYKLALKVSKTYDLYFSMFVLLESILHSNQRY